MPAHDGDVRWPPSAAQDRLLDQLAELIARGGAWRFLRGRVVAAGRDDFPDAWTPSRAGVAALVARLLWHAHVELEVAIEDVRRQQLPDGNELRSTELELERLERGRAWFVLHAIGEDDVAGGLSHEVGRAFLAQLARDGHPFRAAGGDASAATESADLPELAAGSLAAIYLGLGVLACNSAHHERTAGRWAPGLSYVQHHQTISQAGGLDWHDLAFLLAVQATVRDDVITALETLHRTQRIEVEAWIELLDEHEDELRARLALSGEADGAPLVEPPRSPAPLPPHASTGGEEPDHKKFNTGHRTYRVPQHSGVFASVVGATAGTLTLALGLAGPLLAGAIAAGAIGGFALGSRARRYRCSEPRCMSLVTATDEHCPRCGGRIAGEIAHANQRLAKDEELDEAEARRVPETTDPPPSSRSP